MQYNVKAQKHANLIFDEPTIFLLVFLKFIKQQIVHISYLGIKSTIYDNFLTKWLDGFKNTLRNYFETNIKKVI